MSLVQNFSNMFAIRNSKKTYMLYVLGFFTLATMGMVFKSFNDKISLMTGSVHSYQQMVDKQSEQMKAISLEKDRLKRDLNSNGETLKEVRSSLIKLEAECSSAQQEQDAELEEWKKKYRELKDSTAKLEAKYKTLSKSNAESISEIDVLNSENRQLRDKVQEMESLKASELMRLRDSLGLATIDRDKHKDRYVALFKQYQESLDSLQILQDEKERLSEQIREIQRLSGSHLLVNDDKGQQQLSKQAVVQSSTMRGPAVMEEPRMDEMGGAVVAGVSSSSSTQPAPVAAEPIGSSALGAFNNGQVNEASRADIRAPRMLVDQQAVASPPPLQSKEPLPIAPAPLQVDVKSRGGNFGYQNGFGPSSTALPQQKKKIDALSPVVDKGAGSFVKFGTNQQQTLGNIKFAQPQEPVNTRYGAQAPAANFQKVQSLQQLAGLPVHNQPLRSKSQELSPINQQLPVRSNQAVYSYNSPVGQQVAQPQLVQKHQYGQAKSADVYPGAQHPHQQLLQEQRQQGVGQRQQGYDKQLGQLESQHDVEEFDEFNGGDDTHDDGDEYENDLDALQAPDLPYHVAKEAGQPVDSRYQAVRPANNRDQYFYPGQHLDGGWNQLIDSGALLGRGANNGARIAASGDQRGGLHHPAAGAHYGGLQPHHLSAKQYNGLQAWNNIEQNQQMNHYIRDF